MNITSCFIVIWVVLSASVSCNIYTFGNKGPGFKQLASKLGVVANDFDVITEDGYILKIFHLPGDKRKPVLLMHGIIDSADTFILRENSSLAITLAKLGYDVWLGNSRGNKYSRRHITLNPDNDKTFWDFSFHELGFYDLPAIIDFILEKTDQRSLTALGHSQGNTIFLVLGALRPEYNNKVNVLIALSPVCYLNNLKNVPYLLINSVPIIDRFFKILNQEELLGDNTFITRSLKMFCSYNINYEACAKFIFFPVAGSDPEELETDFIPKVVAHYPTGTSLKNANHLSQVHRRRSFSQFDYTIRNTNVYNSTVPPEYNFSNVIMKIALISGRNDNLSTLDDVNLLKNKLPNIIEHKILAYKKFNHLDAVWGRNMNKYLYPHIFKILTEYT